MCEQMEIIYEDTDILVCIKPPKVLSTDEPGGLPELVRQYLQNPTADLRTVHRLDRAVSGLMVLARNAKAASELSRQVREGTFQKEYLAVVHGMPEVQEGTLEDFLLRDKARKMTMVVPALGKDVQKAILHYRTLETVNGMCKQRIQLVTGRTHQIRVQFSSRGMPLVGERKYAQPEDDCPIALWSYKLCFTHPGTGEKMEFSQTPPERYPWSLFSL